MPKNVQTNLELCSFHMLIRLCSKSFKLGFSNTWTKNFQMYKLGLEKTEPEIKLPTSVGSQRKQGSSRKTSTSASMTMLKPFTYGQQTGKFLKGWKYQTTLPVSWQTCMPVKKQQLEADMKQLTGSKLGREYIKAVYCHPAYLTYMQSVCVHSVMPDSLQLHQLYPLGSADRRIFQSRILEWVAICFSRGSSIPRNRTHMSCISCIGRKFFTTRIHHVKCQAGWITNWNQDCSGKYQQLQICRWYHSNGRKWRGTKEPLDEGEKGGWKSWLDTQH